MTEFSEPNNINKDILLKLKSILDSNFYASVKKSRFLSVNVEDRCANNFSDFSTIITGS